jgi:YYY domain-containing protein
MVLKLTGAGPTEGYNLAVALLFGLSAVAVFTLAGTLAAALRPRGDVAVGLLAIALCLVLGNLAGVRTWFDAESPPGDYAWFDPSRVIPGTINEFPAFSFTLQDLHAHVLALPFTLLALGFALQLVLAGPRGDVVWRAVAEVLAAGLAVGVLYAINSWSYPVTAGLLVIAAAVWMLDPRSAGRRAYALTWTALVVLAGVVLVLPFWLAFDPAANGVGIVDERRSFTYFVGDHALIYGILLWPAAAAYAGRVLAGRRPLRTAVWGLVALLFAGSLLAPADLAGALMVAAALAIALHALVTPALEPAERFLWLLLAGAATCALLPELVYVRDQFDGSELFRMNTVFKMGYQAYVLLAVAAACAVAWAGEWLPRRVWAPWAAVAAALLLLGAVYPYAGTYARKDGFTNAPTLDGLGWLRATAPGDVEAIDWLRANTRGDAVVLEAVGDDYSEFGHGRISTFTGRPTVLGWPGHELQWEHPPGNRAEDVRTLYTTTDLALARRLLARYDVRYVVVGPIERADYGDAGLEKWDRLGRRVFESGATVVWELDR